MNYSAKKVSEAEKLQSYLKRKLSLVEFHEREAKKYKMEADDIQKRISGLETLEEENKNLKKKVKDLEAKLKGGKNGSNGNGSKKGNKGA